MRTREDLPVLTTQFDSDPCDMLDSVDVVPRIQSEVIFKLKVQELGQLARVGAAFQPIQHRRDQAVVLVERSAIGDDADGVPCVEQIAERDDRSIVVVWPRVTVLHGASLRWQGSCGS